MKKISQKDEYTPKEMRQHMHMYIKVSAEHLRKQLRVAWKNQPVSRNSRHEVTV